jgi:toxin ParE1/3/4
LSDLPLDVILAPAASDDLQDILQYTLETWGAGQMEKYADLLERALRKLAASPALGRSREDLYPGCQWYQAGSHCIYYDVRTGTLRVARILHMRMDAARHLLQ